MNCKFPHPNATTRIFCFPWGGGGAEFYLNWGKDIPDSLEVHAYCLPGREMRRHEPFCSDTKAVIDDMVKTIAEQYSDKPFYFWGHSMGALCAFNTAEQLKRRYNIEPEGIFVSSIAAPHTEDVKKQMRVGRTLTKELFLELMQVFGSLSSKLMDNPNMLDDFFRRFGTDFVMAHKLCYELVPGASPPLSCRIDYIEGDDDLEYEANNWDQLTSGPITYQTYSGDHFYLLKPENVEKIFQLINNTIAEKAS